MLSQNEIDKLIWIVTTDRPSVASVFSCALTLNSVLVHCSLPVCIL